MTCEDVCYQISKEHCKEKADTCMLLHALHAAKGGYHYKSVVLIAEDTDVLIICLGLHKHISAIYQNCGTKKTNMVP